jgi:hypothetical protein
MAKYCRLGNSNRDFIDCTRFFYIFVWLYLQKKLTIGKLLKFFYFSLKNYEHMLII